MTTPFCKSDLLCTCYWNAGSMKKKKKKKTLLNQKMWSDLLLSSSLLTWSSPIPMVFTISSLEHKSEREKEVGKKNGLGGSRRLVTYYCLTSFWLMLWLLLFFVVGNLSSLPKNDFLPLCFFLLFFMLMGDIVMEMLLNSSDDISVAYEWYDDDNDLTVGDVLCSSSLLSLTVLLLLLVVVDHVGEFWFFIVTSKSFINNISSFSCCSCSSKSLWLFLIRTSFTTSTNKLSWYRILIASTASYRPTSNAFRTDACVISLYKCAILIAAVVDVVHQHQHNFVLAILLLLLFLKNNLTWSFTIRGSLLV